VAIDPDVLTAQQRAEIRSFVGALGRLNGFDELPQVDEGQQTEPLPTLVEAFDGLTNAQHLPAPARLELLARLVQAEDQQGGPLLPDTNMRRWAASLVDADAADANANLTQGQAADTLMEALRQQTDRSLDPLGRSVKDLGQLAEPSGVATTLLPDIRSTILNTWPRCEASTTDVDGVQALDIVTEAISRRPLDQFQRIVNPEKWRECWLQRSFFTGMKRVDPRPPARALATGKPDNGWRATVLETVDFGMGLVAPNPISTPLEVVFFFNDPPADGALARVGGCTYDMVAGGLGRELGWDGRIVVDSGFLLAESVDFEEHTYTRYRTEKRVRFATGFPKPGRVCQFWSLAAGLIMQGCAHSEEEP
jgi:hypothetical protein